MQFQRKSNPLLEKEILSAVLSSEESRVLILTSLKPSDFTVGGHVSIFLAMQSLFFKDIAPTITNVCYELEQKEYSTGLELVPTLYEEYFPAAFLEQKIEELKNISYLNLLMLHFADGVVLVDKGGSNLDGNLKEWSRKHTMLLTGQTESHEKSMKEIISKFEKEPDRTFIQVMQERQAKFRAGEKVFTGHPTHFKDLDNLFDGFRNGHLTIIGARPGVGKSSFMMALASNLCIKSNLKAAIFSLEMPSESLAEKMLFSHSRVDYKRAKRGELTADEINRLYGSEKALKDVQIHFIDKAKINLSYLSHSIKALKDVHNIDIAFIDYLQLISPTDRKKSKYEQITDISQELKIIAKDIGIPVVCLAQLNRNAADGKPKISDLRDSGAIEQDADEIFLLHCPSLDDPLNKPGILEVIIGKNRFGQTGRLELCFEKSTGFIGDLAPLNLRQNEEFESDEVFHRRFPTA